MSDRNLYQRINEVRKAVAYIQKDKSVSTGGGSYKAVTHDTVTAMVRGPMIEAGIVCYPYLVQSMMNAKEEGSKQARYDATYDFEFINCDKPEDRLTIRIQAHAMDNADKAPGKALSYAKKYAMLKLFELETGEDEESRYNKDEFQVAEWAAKIAASADLEELRIIYGEAVAAAKDDKLAVKLIVKAKDSRKAALMPKSEEVKP
ncbi:MAG: ERF family protein [Georgfuchsia sp.]